MKKAKLHPVHPGEVLLDEFLKPLGLSQNRLDVNIGVPARRINEIVLGRCIVGPLVFGMPVGVKILAFR